MTKCTHYVLRIIAYLFPYDAMEPGPNYAYAKRNGFNASSGE